MKPQGPNAELLRSRKKSWEVFFPQAGLSWGGGRQGGWMTSKPIECGGKSRKVLDFSSLVGMHTEGELNDDRQGVPS